MPYTERSKLLAFLLNIIPGVGHYYWTRKANAFVYTILFFGCLAGGIFFSVVASDGTPFLVSIFIAALLWGLSMLHIVISLLRYDPRAVAAPYPPHAGPNPYGFYSQSGPYGQADLTGEVPEGATDTGTNAPGYNHYQQGHYGMAGSPAFQKGSDNERFFTILLSFIPGLGHLHLGLMQRGLSFLLSFFGFGAILVFITSITNESGFLAFAGVLPIIWLYCMFDAVQHVHRKQAGDILQDRTLFEELEYGRVEGRRSKMLATILSVFPGAGHMYIGLQKRGLQLMLLFLGFIYILDVLHLSLFLFLIPVVWFYSFFDALQQVSRYGQEQLIDKPVIGMFAQYHRWVGLGLLLLGAYYILINVLVPTLDRLFPDGQIYNIVDMYLRTIIVSFLLIGGGVWMMIGNSKSKRAKEKR
ncbi:multi-tm2 domain protein [Paenibacillus sp. EKM202P]|uniref:multi-tm2 domain protein n=1 Tax=unclassified Paenibacillus TaxID=185978 RepID=UPI000FB0CB45|nr:MULTISPECIES: multi-tm2 domain protein [unclassified Paenibacillus]KAF6563070.1 multi-tm2 domain protein [Paenibacillus sp. EKM202P]KAF6569659.1 multi-tm2 domain protein [Paenibacillus sp. EKM207P]